MRWSECESGVRYIVPTSHVFTEDQLECWPSKTMVARVEGDLYVRIVGFRADGCLEVVRFDPAV